MQHNVVIAILGWLLVTVIFTAALFVALNFILVAASFLVWDSLYTVDVTLGALRLSALISGILAAGMMMYDWVGFKEAWSSWGDDD
ncbi:hypothetical protein [Caudoviricetes sp.]|nr:hypothetical protein [Caudoviricetes sp.]